MMEQPYLNVVNVAIPSTTEWEAGSVLTFTEQLMNCSNYLALLITSLPSMIRWSIEVPRSDTERVVHALKAYYAQAQIELVPKTATHIGYYLYHLEAFSEFVCPLQYVGELKQTDPLMSLIEALSSVKDGEEMVFDLTLTRPTQNWYTLGDRLLTPTGIQKAFDSAFAGTAETEKSQAYWDEYVKLGRTKIGKQKLSEVRLGIKIKTTNRDRANALADLISPTLRIFDRKGGNLLVWANKDSYPLILSPSEVAALWHLPTAQCKTPRVVWAKPTSAIMLQPSAEAKATDYVVLGTSEYLGKHQPVYLAYQDRQNHVNIVGKTETGKSTLIGSLVRQDILNRKTVGVIDPKGDLIKDILGSIPEQRERDVVLFDVADKAHPLGLNLLALSPGLAPDDVAGRVLNLIKKFFIDDWPGEQTEGAFYAAILTLLYAPGSTIMDIARLFNDDEYRKRVLIQVDDVSSLEFWDDYHRRSSGDRLKIATPVITRARRFYRDRTLQRIICQAKGLNFRWLIDNNKIFLASLAGVGELEAYTLGALLITKFQLAVMDRTDITQRPPVYLYIDEVQNFATHSLGTMFSQGRSFGLSLATANQYFSQLPGQTLEAVLGNVGTNICFAVGESSAKQLKGVMRPEFSPDDLQQLDKFSAAVKMQKQGQTLPAFLLHTLPPLALPDVTAKIDRIRQHSQQTYGRPATEVDAELKRRYGPSEPDQASGAPPTTAPTEPPSATLGRGDLNLADIWE